MNADLREKAGDSEPAGLRIDKWLWYVRFYKTRGQATAAVKGGHVKVNGERGKPGTRVRAGDRVDIARKQLEYSVTVTALPSRRGSAKEAAAAYEESTSSIEARAAKVDALRSDRRQMAMTRGRPDKHTRRALRGRNREGH